MIDNIINYIGNSVRLKKENAIKDKTIRDVRTLYESEKEAITN